MEAKWNWYGGLLNRDKLTETPMDPISAKAKLTKNKHGYNYWPKKRTGRESTGSFGLHPTMKQRDKLTKEGITQTNIENAAFDMYSMAPMLNFLTDVNQKKMKVFGQMRKRTY